MHELEKEFEILYAMVDSLLDVVQSGAAAAAGDILGGKTRVQLDKTRATLRKTITDFSTFENDLGEEEEEEEEGPTVDEKIRIETAPAQIEEEDEEEEEEDER